MIPLKSLKAKERKLRRLRKETTKLFAISFKDPTGLTDEKVEIMRNAYNILNKTEDVTNKANKLLKKLK